jgi:hypothetical protein
MRTILGIGQVGRIDPFDSTDHGANTRGDGPFLCSTGLTYARFWSQSAVGGGRERRTSCGARDADGRAKIFVRNSPDGVSWNSPAEPVDTVPRGHRYFPDIASADRRLAVVFQDPAPTRVTPASASCRAQHRHRPELRRGHANLRGQLGERRPELERATGEHSWLEPELGGPGLSRSLFFGDCNYVGSPFAGGPRLSKA